MTLSLLYPKFIQNYEKIRFTDIGTYRVKRLRVKRQTVKNATKDKPTKGQNDKNIYFNFKHRKSECSKSRIFHFKCYIMFSILSFIISGILLDNIVWYTEPA